MDPTELSPAELVAHHRELSVREAAARQEHESVLADLRELEGYLEHGLAVAVEKPQPRPQPPLASRPPLVKPSPSATKPKRVTPALREVILAMPLHGSIDLDEAAEIVPPEEGVVDWRDAVANRLSRSKGTGLVESAGRGLYRLTEEGRAYKEREMALAPDDDSNDPAPPALSVIEGGESHDPTSEEVDAS